MFAQVSVSGKVVDAGGIEMPGVNIAIKGTMVGTMTGADGTFTLSSIPGGKDAVLVFSFIGFRSQEVKVGNQTFINVKLEEDTEQLEEVVVIGYGTARKKDLSGAISNVQMTDELAALPNPNVMGSLSSKVAGFRYSPTNSAGGDNFSSLNIRGKNAIPADVSAGQQSVNQPLLIVDGVISFGSINEINTNDIQSVDVLKDASAAAIYGSRAANGVIIITTKRGLSERPVINVNSSWNFSGWSRMPKMVTEEEKFFRNRFYAKQAGGSIPSDAVWSDYSSSSPYEKPTEKSIGISLDDAKKLAQEKADAMGLDDLNQCGWDYAIQTSIGTDDNSSYLGSGYVIYYSRTINGTPLTYTMDAGGALEDMDSTMETWAYENLYFYVNADGIDSMTYCNPYTIGETKTENLSLLPFSEIMNIYEKMMIVTNADNLTYENSRVFNIDRIVLGYARIYEPSTDSHTGLLVPVWDFFGSRKIDSEYDGETYSDTTDWPTWSFLTINAVDGSIIDRSLGY